MATFLLRLFLLLTDPKSTFLMNLPRGSEWSDPFQGSLCHDIDLVHSSMPDVYIKGPLHSAYSTRSCPKLISDWGHFVQYCAQHLSPRPRSDMAGAERVTLLGQVASEVLFCFCVARAYANRQPGWLFIGVSHSPKVRLLKESGQNQGHFLALIWGALFLVSEEKWIPSL